MDFFCSAYRWESAPYLFSYLWIHAYRVMWVNLKPFVLLILDPDLIIPEMFKIQWRSHTFHGTLNTYVKNRGTGSITCSTEGFGWSEVIQLALLVQLKVFSWSGWVMMPGVLWEVERADEWFVFCPPFSDSTISWRFERSLLSFIHLEIWT
jgi:hypothetical protein